MERLRLRVFTHLQRLSLSYYEREKAGVILTRMTSDVENLTALFQEGLVQMAVQGLTVVTIAVIMLGGRPAAGRGDPRGHHARAGAGDREVPLRRPPSAYDDVRDRISDLLGDLTENLSGDPHRDRPRPGGPQRRVTTTPSSADYRRANLVTARIGSLFGSVGDTLGRAGPGGGAGHRRAAGPRRSADPGHPVRLPAVPQPALRPGAAAGAALHHLPAGPVVGVQAGGPARDPAERCMEAPDATELPPDRGPHRAGATWTSTTATARWATDPGPHGPAAAWT